MAGQRTQTIAINGRSYRLKDHATAAGKEDKSKKTKSKSNDTSAAEPASRMVASLFCSFYYA